MEDDGMAEWQRYSTNVELQEHRPTSWYKFCAHLLIDLVAGCEHPNFETFCLIFKTTFFGLRQILNYTCFPTQGELRFQSRPAMLTFSLFYTVASSYVCGRRWTRVYVV